MGGRLNVNLILSWWKETDWKRIPNVTDECGQGERVWHRQSAATLITLERRAEEMLRFGTANCFWQDKSVKHKQLQRHKHSKKEDGMGFDRSDMILLDGADRRVNTRGSNEWRVERCWEDEGFRAAKWKGRPWRSHANTHQRVLLFWSNSTLAEEISSNSFKNTGSCLLKHKLVLVGTGLLNPISLYANNIKRWWRIN